MILRSAPSFEAIHGSLPAGCFSASSQRWRRNGLNPSNEGIAVGLAMLLWPRIPEHHCKAQRHGTASQFATFVRLPCFLVPFPLIGFVSSLVLPPDVSVFSSAEQTSEGAGSRGRCLATTCRSCIWMPQSQAIHSEWMSAIEATRTS